MKRKWKYFLQRLLVNDISYKLFSPFLYIAERLKASREDYRKSPGITEFKKKADYIFREKTVLHGPFKGLRYENVKSYGSSYYAKLLGSYESEIHPFLKKVLARQYQSVINIGCDDGYYATGLARIWKGLQVHAYDSNTSALSAARELAKNNQVEDHLYFGPAFTKSLADEMDTTPRLLVVDCEGDEMKIFTKNNAANFCNSDLIIELHLHLFPGAVAHFTDLFAGTHTIEIADSIPSHLKAINCNYQELKELDFESRYLILEERDVFMQWILLSSKRRLS